jgi:hypothetical protein
LKQNRRKHSPDFKTKVAMERIVAPDEVYTDIYEPLISVWAGPPNPWYSGMQIVLTEFFKALQVSIKKFSV